MQTHAIGRLGTGALTSGETVQIGENIILPANGPWLIYNVWSQAILVDKAINDGVVGLIILDSSGDVTPDPAPGQFPLVSHSTRQTGFANVSDFTRVNFWRTRLIAPGKSQIQLKHTSQHTLATAPVLSVGIIFDKMIPILRYSPWSANVSKAVSTNVETLLGTIIISESAKRISSLYCDFFMTDFLAADQNIIGTFRLDSDDIDLTPSIYPAFRAYAATAGNSNALSTSIDIEPIILDVTVPGGARINIFCTLNAAVTTPVIAQCFLTYE